jgi:hypothetical protein
LIILGVVLAAITACLIITRGPGETGPIFPPGKVAPSFAGRLLLAPDGTVWLADYADADGTTTVTFSSFLPGNDWTMITGSEYDGMAIKEDGSLWWWFNRRTRNNSQPVFNPPAQIGSDRDWAQARFSWNSAILLKKNGSIWFFGGKFRDSNSGFTLLTPDLQPVQIGSETDWSAIATSGAVHYAVKRNGTLWHWGNLVYRGPYISTPALMSMESDWEGIVSDFFSMAAVKRDGSLWFGGANAHVIAPKFASVGRPSPFRAGEDTDWVRVAVGDNSLVAQKADGTWWATGENHYAHLGLPHWFGLSKHLRKPTRIPIKLDVWAWQLEQDTTKLLTRRGNIYYMGKRPGSGTRTASVQQAINKSSRWIPGLPPLFARPGEDWSEKPVKIGKLPPEVISALRNGR